ncbi:MAG: hypothetical protein Q8S84_05445 [bacterium]|nr:hypothetical protein [bacterium]MDP3380935.1 hypothetical protein [bacterium]
MNASKIEILSFIIQFRFASVCITAHTSFNNGTSIFQDLVILDIIFNSSSITIDRLYIIFIILRF